jgi:hypothetical protein
MTTYKSVKYNISGADLTGLTAGQIPNLDTAKITTGTFADARISSGSVTQHASDYIAWQSVVTASTLTAVAGRGYPINTTSNACTVTLPASASVGDTIKFVDYARNWGTNKLTINPNSLKFQGNTSPNPEYNTNGQSVTLTYVDVTQGWIPTVDDDATLETPQGYDAEYLVVAGGGCGGGTNVGAGGGAGGYRTNFGGSAILFSSGTVYTATIGAGGVGTTTQGTDGGDSTLSGSDITDIVSTGGGAGGGNSTHGSAGGSGGGAGATDQGSGSNIGAGNTPSTSPVQGYNGGLGHDGAVLHTLTGGGGGAGQVGGDGTQISGNSSSHQGGNGGDGLSNSITGSAVTYAGGGGGSLDQTGATTSSGGAGGGGIGYMGSGVPTNGTDGLGGGGGGGDDSSGTVNLTNGGSGVIILRMLTSSYSGTTTNSPTITTDGSYTVIKFLATGTYTA